MLSQRHTRQLLNDLCVELGFCLPPADVERLAAAPPTDVLAFTDAVLSTEGLSPETADRHLYRQVRDMVAAAFRSSGADG
ncbi:MAG: hypothetical protein MJD61_09205 [Proteobacteria bacterium]|nr:hypothetical protein [Pseudomonadota bacterium]